MAHGGNEETGGAVVVRLARFLAAGCGSGYAPAAPGTVASAVAVLLGAAMLAWAPLSLPLAAALATAGGVWVVHAAQVENDPGWVVIDEYAGQWIALLALARPNLLGLALAFLLFRLLDIAKPGPVGWADRQPGALGVMADDVIAGAIAAVLLYLVRLGWPTLLG